MNEEFKKAVEPLMEYMNEHPEKFNPHHIVIVDCNTVQVLSGVSSYTDNQFLKD